MQSRDFTSRTQFPGNSGNNFEIFLYFADLIKKLPVPIFALLLAAIALVASRFDLSSAGLLFAFYLSDWLLIALLPCADKSYGPAQPPVLILAVLRAPFALLPFPWWVFIELVGTIFVIYGFWIEPHRLTLTHQTLRSTKLGLKRPLRVLHLGDIHVERLTGRERALIGMVKCAAADVILFSGDLLNLSYTRDALAHDHVREVLGQLDAPMGVFVVSGSPVVDPPEVVSHLVSGLDNIRWLRDEITVITHEGRAIEIVGLGCTHRPFLDGPTLTSTLKESERECFRILLYHSPDLAPEASQAGIDLQLSGHTHGGQVRIPFYGALYASSLYGKAFEVGRKQIGDLTLFVSRGIGLEGGGAPRVRFNCPPEVIMWEIS